MKRLLYKTEEGLRFCPGDGCPCYGHVCDGKQRKCFYEPQCWRGFLDALAGIMKLRFRKV